MSKYKWSFANVGGVTRVRIKSAEDVRHLGELDKKMWTVLSCPVNGLEISSDSLRLMDQDGDGQLRLKEVVATADWLCATLRDPQSLFEQSDVIMFCRKMYVQELKKECFTDTDNIDKWYKDGDFHTMYVVEIEKLLISENFKKTHSL